MSHHSLGNGHQADISFLIEKNADGILVLDGEGRVVFANPAAGAIFGRPPHQLVGSSIGLPVIAGETAEIEIHRPGDGNLDVEIRAVETEWDQAPALMLSLRDISARRALEEQLRHTAKMEAIGKLTAGIAHDFNNLLTVIIGNLDMARRAMEDPDSYHIKLLDNAMHGARRAAKLTERMLAFARRKPLEPRVLDAAALLEGMSDMLQRTLGEKIVLQIAPTAGPLLVEVDQTELEAAILNLAVNARDAMPSGGQLVIRTLPADLPKRIDQLPEGPYVLIAVSDTGTGMPTDVLSHVFEPFFTTKINGQGTGLGLSHVYGFVKQSGGHVEIESELGIGTTVTLYLPHLVGANILAFQPAGSASTAPERVLAGTGETVLVVEDNEAVRALAMTWLRELGYRALEASDGPSALAIIDAQPDLALLLTDLGLPGSMDGRAVAEHARQKQPALPVVFMTAYAAAALVHQGRLDSGIILLNKPFTQPDLARRVGEALYRKQRPPKILVTEDEPLIRMWIVDVLGNFRCEVEEAATGGEALAKYRDSALHFDAAIIDLGLPDIRGDDVVDQIRAVDPAFPVVLATGYADPKRLERFKSDPRLVIVGKPFEPEKLKDALVQVGLKLQDASSGATAK